MDNVLSIKNAKSPFPTFSLGAPFGRVQVSVVPSGDHFQAEIRVDLEIFTGTGKSVTDALASLLAAVKDAAVKQERMGRPSDRAKVATALMQLGPAKD